MVFVKVRETYDLHTLRNKMSVIGIHTPGSKIIKRNYPGLLMQCKAYRPVSCDVKMACASMLPLDPQGVGTTEGDVAPEDVFNPILYKAVSNKSMSQIELFLENDRSTVGQWTARGDSLDATNDGILTDDFGIYYGLLSNTHEWKHASPQAGLSMSNLRPLVYEMVYNIGQGTATDSDGNIITERARGINPDGTINLGVYPTSFVGSAKPMPMLWTTNVVPATAGGNTPGAQPSGFAEQAGATRVYNSQVGVPAPKVYCGLIIVPPSRLHQLFYRLVCEWTLEFTGIRPLSEIADWSGLALVGNSQHVQDYDFGNSKVLVESTELVDTSDGSGIKKVM